MYRRLPSGSLLVLDKYMKSVLLGFSGGIDSTTAVERLKGEGYRVVAITIDTMLSAEAVERARQRAEELGIEWYLYDGRERFERDIVEYFCSEFSGSETRSPFEYTVKICLRGETAGRAYLQKIHITCKQKPFCLINTHLCQIFSWRYTEKRFELLVKIGGTEIYHCCNALKVKVF